MFLWSPFSNADDGRRPQNNARSPASNESGSIRLNHCSETFSTSVSSSYSCMIKLEEWNISIDQPRCRNGQVFLVQYFVGGVELNFVILNCHLHLHFPPHFLAILRSRDIASHPRSTLCRPISAIRLHSAKGSYTYHVRTPQSIYCRRCWRAPKVGKRSNQIETLRRR